MVTAAQSTVGAHTQSTGRTLLTLPAPPAMVLLLWFPHWLALHSLAVMVDVKVFPLSVVVLMLIRPLLGEVLLPGVGLEGGCISQLRVGMVVGAIVNT